MLYRGTIRIPAERVLIAFESAARHGSFSRAARELRISRSAVRSRICGLEEELSIRLFERSRSGLSLTEAGRRFRDAVVDGLAAIQAGAAEVTRHAELAKHADAGDAVMGLAEDTDPCTGAPRERSGKKTAPTS